MLINIGPGGKIRAVHDDDFDLKKLGDVETRRGSEVEAIQEGPYKNWWYADFSVLGVYLCLGPFEHRRDALAAEKAYLEQNWVRPGDARPPADEEQPRSTPRTLESR